MKLGKVEHGFFSEMMQWLAVGRVAELGEINLISKLVLFRKFKPENRIRSIKCSGVILLAFKLINL